MMVVLHLMQETERLARLVAARSGRSAEEVVRAALEREARALGMSGDRRPRRMTAAQILAVGAEIAAFPALNPRTPREIMDNLGGP
jgi:antitoxin VapB